MSKGESKGESRFAILSAVSDWLKLLALTVIVAESIILVAMQVTPQSNPIAPYYPIFMLLFLIVIVIGVFMDRYSARKTPEGQLTVKSGDLKATINTNELSTTEEELTRKTDLGTMFKDSLRGFMFKRPKLSGWHDPQNINYGEFVKKVVRTKDIGKWDEAVKLMGEVHPFTNMILRSSCLLYCYGEPINVKLTEKTSSPALDKVIKNITTIADKEGEPLDKDEINELRKSLIPALVTGDLQLELHNYFAVFVLDKSLADNFPVAPSLGNIFLHSQFLSKQPVDTLVANERSILWSTTTTTTNVLIDGQLRELKEHIMSFLVENPKSIFLVSIYFSPQTSSSPDLWTELREMLNSFRVLS